MRLIDADAINPMRCPKSISEMREWINEQPTVCDIEQIRAEIEELATKYNPPKTPFDGGYNMAIVDALRVIKELTKGVDNGNE